MTETRIRTLFLRKKINKKLKAQKRNEQTTKEISA